jgi:hypothetical protein
MAAARTPVWKIVLIVVIALVIAIPLLAFLAQRTISPGSSESATQGPVSTTSTLP